MEEERIGLFLDFENLAIGARERGIAFDFKPIADALAERGRVVVRRAYADWSMFGDAGRDLTRHHVELIEIPQRMGRVRKNSADIKLAVDAVQLSYEREFISTFVILTGDSDFTPLVHKLRELNKRVIGIGIEASTSALLPPACDEFLFYERLPGVDQSPSKAPARSRTRRPAAASSRSANGDADGNGADPAPAAKATDLDALGVLVTQTLTGLKRRAGDAVLASSLKRTLLRKDPTFDESDYGFRTLRELLNNLAERNVISLTDGSAPGDPEVDFPQGKSASADDEAFELLRDVVTSLNHPHLPGLKSQMRKRQRNFTEKRYGYGGFLQFCKAAQARGYVDMEWDDNAGAYILGPAGSLEKPAASAVSTDGAAESAPADPTPTRTPAKTPLIVVPALAADDDAPTEPTPVIEAEVVDVTDGAPAETPPAEKKKRAPRKSTAKPKATKKTTAKTTAKRAPRASKSAAKE
jgi:uncharacterized protein (TIGR00288 family)